MAEGQADWPLLWPACNPKGLQGPERQQSWAGGGSWKLYWGAAGCRPLGSVAPLLCSNHVAAHRNASLHGHPCPPLGEVRLLNFYVELPIFRFWQQNYSLSVCNLSSRWTTQPSSRWGLQGGPLGVPRHATLMTSLAQSEGVRKAAMKHPRMRGVTFLGIPLVTSLSF